MSGFDDHSELVKIFAVNEWFNSVGYKISIISRFIQDDFGYKLSISVGDFENMDLKIELKLKNTQFKKQMKILTIGFQKLSYNVPQLGLVPSYENNNL